jgi:outer membrane protein assembly factor BamB
VELQPLVFGLTSCRLAKEVRVSHLSFLGRIAPFLLVGVLSSGSLAAQTLTLSPASGPPGIGTTVHGSDFPANTAVRVSFDGTMALAPVISDGSGAFNKGIRVPASAQPGHHRVAAGVSGLGALAATKFLVRTDWREFGFIPVGGRFNPYENTLNVSSVPGLQELWSFTSGSGVFSSPAVVNGVVYVGSDDGNLYALNASTGAKRWSFASGGLVRSSPAVANGVVYVDSLDNNVYALNASTGAELWSFTGSGGVTFSGPAVANGVVYVGSLNNVYALNANTGTLLWSFISGEVAAPAVANGVVYVGATILGLRPPNFPAGFVWALNASTGEPLWSFANQDAGFSSPAVANGVVYVGSGDGNAYALNASTGAKLWSFTTGGPVSSPAVANGVVYVGSKDHYVYALNASTGAKLWSFTTGNIVFSSPAVANGVVYVSSYDRNVYALNASTGAKLWSFLTPRSALISSPAVANGVVYVGGAADGKVYAFALPPAASVAEDGVEEEH